MGRVAEVNLLLDTHIWLWAIGEPSRLSRRVRTALERANQPIWLSPISVWEALMLARKGRVRLGDDPVVWINRALENVPTREAVLTHAIAQVSFQIDLPHGDPADRFIVSTASVLGLTLVTSDTQIIQAKAVPTLSNL